MSLDKLIAVDWGTTNARAYRLDADGHVVERREVAQGIMNVEGRRFAEAFRSFVGDWAEGREVLMSGMIGSRQGWVEARYAECPASAGDLATGLARVPEFANVRIVPGLHYRSPKGRHDVIRGEEVQVFGALPDGDFGRHVFCLPGTHSKWVLVEDGRVVRFATAMTGEVFRALEKHSILGTLMADPAKDPGDAAREGFRRGLERAREEGGLLHHLFSARADGLFSAVPAEGIRDYLSGILIGNELKDMVALYGAEGVGVIGARMLTERYVEALAEFGVRASGFDADTVTVRGLARVAQEEKGSESFFKEK